VEKLMDKGSIHGQIKRFMMENGSKGLKMDMGFGKDNMVTHTLESGRIVKPRGMESTHGKMVNFHYKS
jgi:hypothetical protein